MSAAVEIKSNLELAFDCDRLHIESRISYLN
jgi:hypothetical protein